MVRRTLLCVASLMGFIGFCLVSLSVEIPAEAGDPTPQPCCASYATEEHEGGLGNGTCEVVDPFEEVMECGGDCPTGPHDGMFHTGITDASCGTKQSETALKCQLANFNNKETRKYTLTCPSGDSSGACECIIVTGEGTGQTPTYKNCTNESDGC